VEQLDPEMLKNLDVLLDLEAVEQEVDWETLENLEEAESTEASQPKEAPHASP
jgi:hypothetical protein